MSARSKNSPLTKIRKASTSASIQNEKLRSTSNLTDQSDANINNILKAYSNARNGIPDIRIIIQGDPFSNSQQRYKDDIAELTKTKYFTEEFNKPSVYCYGRNESEGPIRLIFKNKVYEHVIPVLNLTTPYFKNLLILQLTYCGLNDSHLSLLKNILDDNLNIKFLSLEGNPLFLQQYNDILKTQLTHLSLRSCQINLDGIKNMAEQLQKCDLVSLNLSSNYLDDDCLQCLSEALRLNRKMSTINLADNWFTDIGLINFINIFKKFQLVHNEVVLRRRINLAYLLEQQHIMKGLISSDFEVKQAIASPKSLRSPNKRSAYKSSSVPLEVSPRAKAILISKEKITTKMKKDANPLIIECLPENKSIYCRGNFVVSTVDLSSNNITPMSLKKLVEVLKYQIEFCYDNKCLQRLLFDEGLNRKYALEMLEISELLKANSKTSKHKITDRIRMEIHPSGNIRQNFRS